MRRRVRFANLLLLALPFGLPSCSLWPTQDVECLASGRCMSDGPSDAVQIFGQPDEHTNLQLLRGLFHPTHVIRMDTTLIIADEKNHRVVLRDDPPGGGERGKDIVLGQPDFATNAPNHGGRTAASLSAPHSLATDGTRLFVADSGNNRVLIWRKKPTQNQQPAELVLGQPDMTTARVATSDRDFGSLPDISIGPDGQVVVTDRGNHRVLIFDSQITQSHQAALYVIGQTDMISNKQNASLTTVDGKGLYDPRGSTITLGKRLGVVDSLNHRVLFWNGVPNTNYATAARVVGQVDFTQHEPNGNNVVPTANFLSAPLAGAGTPLGAFAISDGNNRILFWSSYPTMDGAAANRVLGQPNFVNSMANNGGISARSLSSAEGLTFEGSDLYVADSNNHRVLMFAGLPTTDHASASRVIGQPGFTSAEINNAAEVSPHVYNRPLSVSSGGNRLAIVDSINHRVLLWNRQPARSGTPPDLALGQPDFSASASNHGDAMTSGNGFTDPAAVWTDGTRLAVADLNRVLIWNSWPTASLQPADIVLGQPDLRSNLPNAGTTVSATSLWKPSGISSHGNQFVISDSYNHRVLIWKMFPTSTQEPAHAVVGQSLLTTNSSNQGAALCTPSPGNSADARLLACPEGVFLDANKLYVADRGNARVMIWNGVPQGLGEAASFELGHPQFKGSMAATSPTDATFMSVSGVAAHNGRLYVSDPTANRVMYWNAPTENGQAADGVIGQSSLTESYRATALDANRFAGPLGLGVTDQRLYISDTLQDRVVAIPHP